MAGGLRKRIVPIAGLLLVIAITAGIFYFYHNHPGRIDSLRDYGYPGAFFISIIFNATVILPVGNMIILSALGANLPMPGPVIIGLVGGIGAAIGETTGYIAGRSGRDLISRRELYHRVEGWLRRWGWLTVFVLSVVPFIFDVVGLTAGALRFPFWKYFIFCWLGRTILYVSIITLAALGLKIVLPLFG